LLPWSKWQMEWLPPCKHERNARGNLLGSWKWN
jgi:hypothetical protein